MNKDLEEKVVKFLKVISNEDNWKLYHMNDIEGNWLCNYYSWEKKHYDPKFVAQELLDLLFPDDE